MRKHHMKVSVSEAFCYDIGMYPSAIYRVVAKALVVNSEGKILVVKEGQDFWSLPGGGIEHGESAIDCIRREIREEIGVDDVRVDEIVYSTNVYLDRRDMWMTWIVHKAHLGSNDFVYGDGVTDARYIDLEEIRNSDHLLEKLIVEAVQAAT